MCSLTSQAGWINAVMLQMVCNERNWLEIFSSSNNASQGFMLDAWSPADALVACADNIWCWCRWYLVLPGNCHHPCPLKRLDWSFKCSASTFTISTDNLNCSTTWMEVSSVCRNPARFFWNWQKFWTNLTTEKAFLHKGARYLYRRVIYSCWGSTRGGRNRMPQTQVQSYVW